MANSNSKHSKALRKKTAAEFQNKLTSANRFEIRNKDAEKIAAVKSGLATIPGADYCEKIMTLLRAFNQKGKD